MPKPSRPWKPSPVRAASFVTALPGETGPVGERRPDVSHMGLSTRDAIAVGALAPKHIGLVPKSRRGAPSVNDAQR